MVQWNMANYLKGNDPIGDKPIFDWTMTMGGSVAPHLETMVQSEG